MTRSLAALAVSVVLAAPAAASTTFGIFDARTMAMGGAAVASANNDNGQFYNAALLAFNEEHEENTRDSRLWFPMLMPQVSDSALDLEEISGESLHADISAAAAAYNAAPGPDTATTVASAAARLDRRMSSIAGSELYADAWFGLSISEIGKRHGAGFFMGSRLLGSGQPAVSEADLALLQAFREGMTFIATNGAEGVSRPELFDANGALLDPAGDFDSTVTAVGAALTEVGVAMSWQLELFGKPFAWGMSVKAFGIDTFEDARDIDGGRIDTDNNGEFQISPNFDIGLLQTMARGWSVGIAVKDVIPYNYETSAGTRIRLRPRPRLGVAYERGALQLAVDVDLLANEALGIERASQEAAFGAEWAFGDALKLRTGYRHDFGGDREGIASIGVGTLWKRFALDVAYAEGRTGRAAALQFGAAF